MHTYTQVLVLGGGGVGGAVGMGEDAPDNVSSTLLLCHHRTLLQIDDIFDDVDECAELVCMSSLVLRLFLSSSF